MNRNTLKQLVMESYDQGELNPERVDKIANLLTKKELRLYIRSLKNYEKENTVIIDTSFDDYDLVDEFTSIYADKRIVIHKDPSLMLGLKITENDDVLDISLKNTLNKITEHIKEQYD